MLTKKQLGGIKAAKTNKERYGKDFYTGIGAEGGKISRGGGFAYGDLASKAAKLRWEKYHKEREKNESNSK